MGPPAALGPLLLLAPRRRLRAVPRRVAPTACPLPRASATHRGTDHPVPAFRGFLPGHGRADGSGARSGRSWTASQPEAANDRERAGSPAGPVPAREGYSELKYGGPQGKI